MKQIREENVVSNETDKRREIINDKKRCNKRYD
jgi:hypothetical protein